MKCCCSKECSIEIAKGEPFIHVVFLSDTKRGAEVRPVLLAHLGNVKSETQDAH